MHSSALPVKTSRFQLLNHTITVKEFPIAPDAGEYGIADYPKNEIRLYTDGVCESVVEHTFYHELVHFLFHYAGRSDLSDDETLVDTIGGLLAQYEQTKR